MTDREVVKILRDGSEAMELVLSESTGLNALKRKTVIHWTMATHMLPHLSTFPVLGLYGPFNSGKTQCEDAIELYCLSPVRTVARSVTPAVLQADLVAAHNGTSILEESDEGKDGVKNLERLISDRCQRNSAVAKVNEQVEHKHSSTWLVNVGSMFGATVMHRRQPFKDPALDSRSITLRCTQDFNRDNYQKVINLLWAQETRTNSVELVITPVTIDKPSGIADRIFDNYAPLLMSAIHLEDHDFLSQITDQLVCDTIRLKEDQCSEPDALTLRSILCIVHEKGFDENQLAKITMIEICKTMTQEYGEIYDSRQVSQMCENLGFRTYKSNRGRKAIKVNPIKLRHACGEIGWSGEDVDWLNAILQGKIAGTGIKKSGWWSTITGDENQDDGDDGGEDGGRKNI